MSNYKLAIKLLFCFCRMIYIKQQFLELRLIYNRDWIYNVITLNNEENIVHGFVREYPQMSITNLFYTVNELIVSEYELSRHY